MPSASCLLPALFRIESFLRPYRPEDADWLGGLQRLDEDGLWRQLNSSRCWGGAGSLANLALMDNPGLPEVVWQQEIRAFREDLIEIGTALQARGNPHPDLQTWLLAFLNWNHAGI